MHTHTNTHTLIHTHTQTYTQTQTHIQTHIDMHAHKCGTLAFAEIFGRQQHHFKVDVWQRNKTREKIHFHIPPSRRVAMQSLCVTDLLCDDAIEFFSLNMFFSY